MRKRKLTQKQLDKKVLMFSYGSNMHQPRLEERVGPVKCKGAYTLEGFKLTFDTCSRNCSFANVDVVEGETCEGVVYELTYGQLRILDHYEGLYERRFVTYGASQRKLHYYISDYYRVRRSFPCLTMEYYALLMLGCTEHKLRKSLTIISQLKPCAKVIVWEGHEFFPED